MNRLKELRKKNGINQKDLALKLGITQQALSYYENGKRNLSNSLLNTLADFYGVSVPYLQGATYCKKCGNYFFEEDHYVFCPYCGISLEEKTYINRCLDCGTVFFFDAPNYCPLCGGQRFE
ncbi:helix-turn-helix domain-containing protein [Lactobacillus sp. PSON]|uniref:helix-turn-helix domain-containing protein n=1 Tax=Lactobacillus sp. PSON TaxID=3455454 RepID=UPI00404164B2